MPNSTLITPDLSLIRISGTKQEAFLQGQLTCNMADITASQSRLAGHCNAKGRVLASLRVIQFQDNFYLLTPRNMVEITLTQLGKYAPLSRVTLTETSELTLLGCYGQELADALSVWNHALPQQPDQASSANDILFIRIHDNQPRFILVGFAAVLEPLQHKLTEQYPIAQNDIWRLLDIQNGIANIYPETSDLFTPHMLNYPQLNAVSFNKGCYIGQEIIARTHYLGKTKRQLQSMTLVTDKIYKAGEALELDNPITKGVVVDAVHSSPSRCELLAVVQL